MALVTGEILRDLKGKSLRFKPYMKENEIYKYIILGCEIKEYGNIFVINNKGDITIASLEQLKITDKHLMEIRKVKVSSIDFQGLDMKNVTTMHSSFSVMIKLEKVSFKDVDLSSLRTFDSTFFYCHNLREVDLRGVKLGSLETTHDMFIECTNLETVKGLNEIDFGTVRDAREMFKHCTKLKRLEIDKINTHNLVRANEMFYACGVEELDLSKWDTTSLKEIAYMFGMTSGLKRLDISCFDNFTPHLITDMFDLCDAELITKNRDLLEEFEYRKK